MLLGSHTIDTGGIAMAARRAGRSRMSALPSNLSAASGHVIGNVATAFR